MTAGLLSWPAQIAGHAAFVEARRIVAAPAMVTATPHGNGKRRRHASAVRHREALLLALSDGRKHGFADIAAALPGLSRQGTYYLIEVLKAEGRIDYTHLNRSTRTYFLT